MNQLTEELALKAFILQGDLRTEDNEYTQGFRTILKTLLSLREDQTLIRVRDLDQTHVGRWLDHVSFAGFITDVQMSDDDRPHDWHDNRMVVLDGKIVNVPGRDLVILNPKEN